MCLSPSHYLKRGITAQSYGFTDAIRQSIPVSHTSYISAVLMLHTVPTLKSPDILSAPTYFVNIVCCTNPMYDITQQTISPASIFIFIYLFIYIYIYIYGMLLRGVASCKKRKYKYIYIYIYLYFLFLHLATPLNNIPIYYT